MERADHFRSYASMNREKILEMLKAHSNGMKDLSLSLAIIENGRIQCYYYNGESLTEEVPRLIYEIGSVTKTFTAALLMKMISEGMLNLSDSKEILPGIIGLQDVFIRSSDSLKRKKQLW